MSHGPRAKEKRSESNCDATRVTCYPRAGVSHVSLGCACHMLPRAKQSKGKRSRGKQSKGKQKQSKSNCDATRRTCYPRARVSHVTLGRACHMLPRAKQSKGKQCRGKQSKAKQSKSKANQTVTPRVSHVTPKAKQRQAKQRKAEAKQIKL